jgi:hypothetical protein
MKNISKIKDNCINDIINLIKKYNITLDEIAFAYVNKYENNFNENEKKKYKIQFLSVLEYNNTINKYIREPKQKIAGPASYKIIDDYIMS